MIYENFSQIENDLKKLSLEKNIAFEELKVVKNNFEESLRPLGIIKSVAKFATKYGAVILIKKIFKKF